MEILSAVKAQKQVCDIIKYFFQVSTENLAENKLTGKLNATIENVGFTDILELYQAMKTDKTRLYMPWELDCDYITIVYIPAHNCIIQIESVKVSQFKGNKNKINLN